MIRRVSLTIGQLSYLLSVLNYISNRFPSKRAGGRDEVSDSSYSDYRGALSLKCSPISFSCARSKRYHRGPIKNVLSTPALIAATRRVARSFVHDCVLMALTADSLVSRLRTTSK